MESQEHAEISLSPGSITERPCWHFSCFYALLLSVAAVSLNLNVAGLKKLKKIVKIL